MRRNFDIDIDVRSDFDRSGYGTRAMIYNEETENISPHPVGIYLEDVPVDPITGFCAFDYKYGNENGFMKLDLITNSSYDRFKTKTQLLSAINKEPDWTLLESESYVSKLPHIANHFDVVSLVKPRSVIELADTLALIRPGKVHLLEQYLSNREKVRRKLYLRSDKGVYFKKSHAVSYALMIVAVMNSTSKQKMFGFIHQRQF